MRIAFVFPPMLVGGRPVDWHHVWDSPRGLTGSETQLVVVAKEMAARGHICDLYVEGPNTDFWGKVELCELSKLGARAQAYDVVAVALDCNLLRVIPPGPLRVCFQQCNDFRFGEPGWRDWCDLFVLPSEPHRRMFVDPAVRPSLGGLGGWLPADRVAVVPNGCYPEEYGESLGEVVDRQRTRGKCVFISSPDRGLHIGLQEYPAIKRACPWATLDVYYYSLESFRAMYRGQREDPNWNPESKEWLRRSQYIDKALTALAPYGVRAIGSVGRKDLVEVLKSAEVLAYPCDPIAWTESFSCATLEGCASGALPVISEVDCLREVYGAAVPTVPEVRSRAGAAAWRELVIRALTDREWTDSYRRKARALAERLSWRHVAEQMEALFLERLAEKQGRPDRKVAGEQAGRRTFGGEASQRTLDVGGEQASTLDTFGGEQGQTESDFGGEQVHAQEALALGGEAGISSAGPGGVE